jgi:hypothetical protein
MKKILIMNGSGGVGKDTFVAALKKFRPVMHTSIVKPVKDLATTIGWNGMKSEKDRKFLSDLKVLIDEYNDYNYKLVAREVDFFLNQDDYFQIFCIDMREKKDIDRLVKQFGAKKVLVTRDSVKQVTSNIADAGVYEVDYDYFIHNDGTIEDLDNKAKELIYLLENNT